MESIWFEILHWLIWFIFWLFPISYVFFMVYAIGLRELDKNIKLGVLIKGFFVKNLS